MGFGARESDSAESPLLPIPISFLFKCNTITWCAYKQPLVAFSTVEAEYIGASNAAKEAIWIRSLYAGILYGKILYKNTKQCPHCLCLDNDSKATESQQIFVDTSVKK